MKRPKIAITSGKTLSQRYIDAILRAGGEPVVISRETAGYSENCDGLLLSGGGDILPELFRASDYDHSLIRGVDEVRDILELELARRAFEEKLPTLGICRGIQVMAAALDGDLILDLPGHIQKEERNIATHEIITAKGSILYDIVGARIRVNSFHHQAVGKLPDKLRLSAASPDGVIEGIEAADRFFIGVQWHPECLSDRASEKLFSALISAT